MQAIAILITRDNKSLFPVAFSSTNQIAHAIKLLDEFHFIRMKIIAYLQLHILCYNYGFKFYFSKHNLIRCMLT